MGRTSYAYSAIHRTSSYYWHSPQAPAQEAPYQTIVDDQLDPICRFQADFRLTFVNQPFAALYGKTPQALIGENLLNVVRPQYQQYIRNRTALLTAQNPVTVHESLLKLPDGSMRWFQSTNRRFEYADGTIEYQAIARDITELKRVEEAERKQRQLAEAMRDSLAALTSSLDVDQVMTQILASAAAVVASDANRIGLIRDGYIDMPYLRGYPPDTTAWFGTARYILDPQTTDNRFSPEKAYRITDTQQKAGWASFPALAWIRSSIGVPIRVQDKVVGLLVADSTTPNHFQPADVDTLQTFADYASLALSNAYQATRLEQRVRECTAELQNSEAKFQQLIQDAPVAMIVSDQAGRITLVNHQTEALFGYQATELLGQTVAMLVPEADRADLMSERAEYITTAIQHRQMGGRRELFIRRKEGPPVPVEIQTNWIQTADGLLIISFLLDTTERKQATDALRQQRDFLQSVIDHIPSIIRVKNRQGKIQLINQYAAQQLNKAPSELLGKTSAEVNPNPQEVALSQQAMDQVFATQQALSFPESLVKGRYYQAVVVPLPGTTSVDDQVILIAHDITERKAAQVALQQALQAEKELSKLKSGFITNTSHAFRTPLAIILSTAETLLSYRHKLADAPIEQRLMRIVGQVEQMKALLEDVLDLSRIQAQQGNFTPVQCDPAPLCRKLMTELQNHFGPTRQLLYISDVGLPMVNLDENLLYHILNHLISNAVKYSAEHRPVVLHLASRDDALVLTVRDEGIGIPAAEIQHLFQPFYRATNVGSIPGTGLGLSIIKEAVELQQGSITVASQVGVGTTFTVTFPLAASK